MSAPTSIPQPFTTVVVVGGPRELVDAVRQAAEVAASAKVETAEIANAATVIATFRPFAIVMSEDVYAFDPVEFDSLARDVRATLFKIATAGMDTRKLERNLMPKLGRASRRSQR